MPTMSPQEVAEANRRHAAKMAHRRDNPDKVQRYAPNRGAGRIAEIADHNVRHSAKMEARVAAFMAGRKPDADGHLDVSTPDPEAEAKAAEAKAADAKAAEAARAAEAEAKAKAEADAKAAADKASKGKPDKG